MGRGVFVAVGVKVLVGVKVGVAVGVAVGVDVAVGVRLGFTSASAGMGAAELRASAIQLGTMAQITKAASAISTATSKKISHLRWVFLLSVGFLGLGVTACFAGCG